MVTKLIMVITVMYYVNVKLLCCTLEMNIILCVNFTSVKKGGKFC